MLLHFAYIKRKGSQGTYSTKILCPIYEGVYTSVYWITVQILRASCNKRSTLRWTSAIPVNNSVGVALILARARRMWVFRLINVSI